MINRRDAKLVFSFPGQGSFSGEILRELYEAPRGRRSSQQVQHVCRLILGKDFMPLVESRSQQERERLLQACPDFDQVVSTLSDYLTAAALIAAGLEPDLLLGHSFGEIAALAVAGCYSFETGLRIVCQRSSILSHLSLGGRMAAAFMRFRSRPRVDRGLAESSSLEIAVRNHKRQTVVSGPLVELERLRESAASQGVCFTLLKSRHPFHSSLLRPAVEPFRLMLCGYAFQSAAIPVYLCTERRFLSVTDNLSSIISDQLFKQLDFAGILHELHGLGYRRFVECGAGNIATKVTQEAGLESLQAFASAPIADGFGKGSAAIMREFASELEIPKLGRNPIDRID